MVALVVMIVMLVVLVFGDSTCHILLSQSDIHLDAGVPRAKRSSQPGSERGGWEGGAWLGCRGGRRLSGLIFGFFIIFFCFPMFTPFQCLMN